jgi:pimeloyl-ACP methyl ester carboxylesterase
MKKTFNILACLTALTLLFAGCGIEDQAPIAPEVMHGNVVHVDTYNGYYVYTPPNYNANASYPVLYLLNGYGRDEGYFVNTFSATDAADYLLDDRLIGPLIMVMPSGESALGGTFYTNSLHPAVGMAENNILAVIHEVEANYAIDTTKRAIGGHSMGGYGALSIALNYPGMFKAIAVMEAPIAFWGSMPASDQYEGVWEIFPAALLETGYADVLANTGGAGDAAAYKQMMYPSPTRRVTSMMFAMASAFSPTQFDPDTHFPIYVPTTIDSIIVGMNGDVPIKSPMWVDLPMGINGSVEMGVWSRWMAKDCLARFAGGQAANIAGVKLYLDAGNQDDLGLNGAHQTFSMAYQMAFGGASPASETYFGAIPDIFGDIPGGHTQQVYEQLRKLLIWHSGQF